MKFFEMLSNFFMTPVSQITKWMDELGLSIQEALNTFWRNAMIGTTSFLIQGVMVVVICYMVYCAVRIMCTGKDETFSEYMNKSIIAGLAYFFARCGGNIILAYIGG